MPSRAFLITALLLINLCSPQSIQVLTNNTFSGFGYSAMNQGLYYAYSQAFNITSQKVHPSYAFQICSSHSSIKLNVWTQEPWCYGQGSLNTFSANLTCLLGSYQLPIENYLSSYTFHSLEFSGQYAVIHFLQKKNSFWQVYVFDTVGLQTICNINITLNSSQNNLVQGWYDGTILYYTVFDGSDNVLVYNTTNCMGDESYYTQPYPSSTPSAVQKLIGLNNSSVFVAYIGGFCLQTLNFPQGTNEVNVGETLPWISEVTQINDSYFFVEYSDEAEIFTIDENLNLVSEEFLEKSMWVPSYIIGSTQVNMGSLDLIALYDLNTNKFFSVNSGILPIPLLNGNRVLFSGYSYYIFNLDNQIIQNNSVNSPMSSLYQNTSNPSLIYFSYVSSSSPYSCQLFQINILASTVTMVLNVACTSFNQLKNLLYVGIQSNGSYYFLVNGYDESSLLLVSSSGGFVIPDTGATIATASPKLGLYYSINISQNNFVGAVKYISNGAIVNSRVITGVSNGLAACKISDTFFFVVNSTDSGMGIFVWDAVNLVIVQTLEVGVADLILSCFVLGSPQKNSNQFTYAVLSSQTTLYVVDPDGSYSSTDFDGIFRLGIPLSSETFSVQIQDESGFISQIIYEISDSEI